MKASASEHMSQEEDTWKDLIWQL